MTELREILSESVSRLFSDHLTKDVLSASEEGVWSAATWDALVANGLTSALVPEDRGGAGASFQETFAIAYAAGRAAAPLPLVETLAAGWWLARLGLEPPPGALVLVDGEDARDLALDDRGRALTGTLNHVPWGRFLDRVALVMADDPDPRALVVDVSARNGARIEAKRNLAGEPRDRIALGKAPVLANVPLVDHQGAEMPRLLGAMMRTAQMAGAAGWVLDTTLQYATDRVQFGRPLGKLQAIAHYLASLAAQVAQATMASELAFRSIDRKAHDLRALAREIATAKVVVGDAAWSATRIGHQVHGAIGFTAEHELHYRTRRLWCWRAEHGAEAWWAERLGREVVAAGADALWPDMTAV